MRLNHNIYISILVLSILLFNNNYIVGQNYDLEGTIIDSLTHQPIRNASLKWMHQKRGAITDSLGIFHLYHATINDTLQISCMGYATIFYPIPAHYHNNLLILLTEVNNNLQEIIVYPKGYNQANNLFKKILRNKAFNNPALFHSIQYDFSNSLEIDINHLSDKLLQSKWMQPFKQYFTNNNQKIGSQINTPVFLHEKLGTYQYSELPNQSLYQIRRQKSSGIKNESILQYMNQFKTPINIYDNYITLLKTEFISPLSVNGLHHYHYSIKDTCVKGSQTFYQLQFTPTYSASNTFVGYVWVDAKGYAISELNMVSSKFANINWIDSIKIFQQYQLLDSAKYALSVNNIEIHFKLLSNKQPSFSAIQKETYKNILVNSSLNILPTENNSNVGSVNQNMYKYPSIVDTQKNNYFITNENVFKKIDTLKNIPAFKTYSSIFNVMATGYLPMGKIDFGNIYKLFTSNYIEGKRFNLGIRTNTTFSKIVQLSGYVGMGMKDKEPRYALHTFFVLNHNNWETIDFSIQKDFSPLKDNADELNENSLFGALLLRIPRSNIYLVDNQSFQIRYQKFYKNGFSFHVQTSTNQLTPLFDSYFTYLNYKPILTNDPNPMIDGYRDNHISVGFRYVFKEKYFINAFRRKSISSQLPIIDITFTNGVASKVNFLQSDLSYQKIHFSLSQNVMIKGIGNLNYHFTAGYTNGILPILLLDVAKGNDTYYYNPYAYNNMYRYEFITDRFVSLFAEQQLGSFPFNYVPLINRLKWRSVFSIHALEGTMSKANKLTNGYKNPSVQFQFKVPDQLPYTEVGYGIDNIFHVLRLDAIWRLNYLQQTNAPALGIRASLHFSF